MGLHEEAIFFDTDLLTPQQPQHIPSPTRPPQLLPVIRPAPRGESGVWLEIAGVLPALKNTLPIAGKSRYDWSHKFALHLSADDLGKLGWALSSGQKGSILTLHHHYHQKKKTLHLVLDEKGALFLNAHEESLAQAGKPGEKSKRSVSVPLSEDGIWKFKQCIQLAYQETVCHAAYEFEERTE